MDDIVIQNVTDTIGDTYKSWKRGSSVIIPSYVGSGKTHFILEELAKIADEKNKIVYLCNRKALLDQVINKNGKRVVSELEKDCKQDCYVYNENVYILSYQYCEANNMFPTIRIPKSKLYPKLHVPKDEMVNISLKDVRYIIYEEAHYFATDIAFNERCSFWAQKSLVYSNSTSIFMTATPEPLYCFLALNKNPNLVSEIVYDIANLEISRTDISKTIANLSSDFDNYKNGFHNTNDTHQEILKTNNVTPAKSIISGNISASIPGSFGKIKEINEHVELEPLEFYKYTIGQYEDIKEQIKVYSVVVDYVSKIINQYKKEYQKYDISRNYDKYDCYYFDDYSSLYELIVKSTDRWIIFVDNEAEGLRLEGALNTLCAYTYEFTNSNPQTSYVAPYATFLSRETIKKKRSVAYKEYKNIIEKERFSCKVLIATKLIDCGVNIDIKTNINNIVISQPSKTEFIQMLGRVRTIAHKTNDSNGYTKNVKLYIKNIPLQTINGESLQRIKDILDVKSLILYKDRQNRSSTPEAFAFNRFYSKIENKTITPAIKRSENIVNSIGEDLYIDSTYFAYCLYDIYQYYSATMDRKTDADPRLSYLKRQLSWLEKTYSLEKWVGYKVNVEITSELLSKVSGNDYSCKNEELLAIKAQIISILLKIPPSAIPNVVADKIKGSKDALIDYKNSLLEPSLDIKSRHTIVKNKTLNAILKELNIPFEIVTKKTKSKNWWKVVEYNLK